MVKLGLVESICRSDFVKGHTHGPLDGLFEQMRIKPSLPNFKDDMYVVEILNGFLKGSWLDIGTRDGSKAYKLDASARWTSGLRLLALPCPT